MGAGIWVGAVLHRLRHATGDRAPRLRGAVAMTVGLVAQLIYGTELRNHAALVDLCAEAADEIERLRAVIKTLNTSLHTASVEVERLREHIAALQLVATAHDAEIERLRAALQQIADDGRNCADHCRRQARRALEPKP